MTFPLPYVITVSDGVAIRTFHPLALGKHRLAIEAALADLLDARGVASPAVAAPAQPVDIERSKTRPATADMMTQGEIARVQGFTGDCCTGCGGFAMRRNGTCLLCTACGATTGCS